MKLILQFVILLLIIELQHQLRRIKSFYLFKNPDKLFEDKKAKVDYLYDRLNDIFTYNLSNQCNKTKHLMQIFNHQANLFTINQNNHLNFSETFHKLPVRKQERFYYLVSKLNTLSPLTTLERGYAIILKDEKVISKADDLKSGDKVEIKMKGGSQKAIIE